MRDEPIAWLMGVLRALYDDPVLVMFFFGVMIYLLWPLKPPPKPKEFEAKYYVEKK